MNLLNFISKQILLKRLKNNKISPFAFFDRKSFIHDLACIKRFTIIRNSDINALSYIGQDCSIINASIGKYCSISKCVNIGAAKHPTDFISTSPIFYRENNGTGSRWVKGNLFNDLSERIVIGHDVWIGMNSTIFGGVKIGAGAVIGSHSLVTKDVPPYSIVGGVPAKLIRYRFDTDIIELLLNFAWWDLPIDVIKKNILLFSLPLQIDLVKKLISELNLPNY